MNKFQKGDMLVVLQSSDRNNVGKVGAVIDITDGDYYTLDVMPNYAFKEDCLKKAHGADLIREERRRQIEVEGYDTMHDRHHTPQVLCRAAVGYALHEVKADNAKRDLGGYRVSYGKVQELNVYETKDEIPFYQFKG